jgi:protein-S-isoprenylcysteine O-methyltransferase Ste14
MSRAAQYVAGQFVLFAALAIAFIILPPGQTPLLRPIGLALVVIAVIVLALAVIAYRNANAALPHIAPTPDANAGIVISGIYAHVRHPIYTAVLLGGIGVALAHGHFVVMLIALLLIPFFTFKSLYEERLLRAVYPQYEDYMRQTGRFLPYL